MSEKFKKIIAHLKHKKGVTATIVVTLISVALCGGIFACGAGYSKIMPNVTVAGKNLGGMTCAEAEKFLDKEFEGNTVNRSVDIVLDSNKAAMELDELEIKIDSKKTADEAFKIGRQGNVFEKTFKMLALVFGEEELSPEISLNEQAFESVIKSLVGDNEVVPEKASYSLDGDELTVKKGHGGKMVNRQTAKKMVADALTNPSINEIKLKIETLEAEDVDIDAFYAELTSPARDAVYRLDGNTVVIDEEKPSVMVEKAAIKAALESSAENATIKVKVQLPEITKKQLEELLFRDELGRFSSNFATSSASRASNVQLTAQRVNGKILMPGETFSYDKTVGRRTFENGYKEAGVYIGNKTETGIGGGICQTSSTLYSAALYANLEIVSRTSHSLPVSYVPAGQDATIAEGYIDLLIKNNTEYPIKFVAEVVNRNLTCRVLGVKQPDITVELVHTRTADYQPQTERTENPDVPIGYKMITSKGAPGYAVASQRIVKQGGVVIKTEKLTRSVYRAAPVVEEVNPADKDTPTEQLKIYTPGMSLEEEKPGDIQPEITQQENIDNTQPETTEEEKTFVESSGTEDTEVIDKTSDDEKEEPVTDEVEEQVNV